MAFVKIKWDSKRKWDQPHVKWNGSAWVPDPKKPSRRSLRQTQQPTTPSNPMSTFRYNVAPNSNGGFTTRAVRGEPETDAEILSHCAAAAAVTAPQAEAVIRALLDKILSCSENCDWAPDFLGLFSFRPVSGGTSPSPDGFHNADDINADVALTFNAETIRAWRGRLTLESAGETGRVTPVIESVIRQSDGAVDKYTAGGLGQVRGNYCNFDPTDVNQGIFLTPTGGAEVRVTAYASIKPQSAVILFPAGLTGALTMRMATYINGSVRSSTYTNPLTSA